MTPKLPLPPLALAVALSLVPFSFVRANDLAQEYEQVRKIALRDPRVREAFDRANERLEEKIIELDPALKNYAANRSPEAQAPAPAPAHAVAVASTPQPKPKPFVAHPEATSSGRTHVVQSGETLVSIATRYHVSVAGLEAANHISDPRKLQIGQTLVIPEAASAQPAPATTPAHSPPPATKTSPADPQPDNLWDRLKSSF